MYFSIFFSLYGYVHINWLIDECSKLVIIPVSSADMSAYGNYNTTQVIWAQKCVNQHFPKVKKHQNIMNHRLKGMQIAHISSKNDHQLLSTTIFWHIFTLPLQTSTHFAGSRALNAVSSPPKIRRLGHETLVTNVMRPKFGIVCGILNALRITGPCYRGSWLI